VVVLALVIDRLARVFDYDYDEEDDDDKKSDPINAARELGSIG
jgi:hypothetical protein